MNIHVDIRGFLEIHVRICYGFSDQRQLLIYIRKNKYVINKTVGASAL